jgi:hypothetical protein
LLSTYPELSISMTPSDKVDAVLVGIVSSDNRYTESIRTTATNFQNGTTIGKRAGLYVPTASQFQIQVRIILIKNPSFADMELLKSDLGVYMERHPDVVFARSFGYTGAFNRAAQATDSPDSGGIVNYTNTRRFFDQNLETLAQNHARELEELVINVF